MSKIRPLLKIPKEVDKNRFCIVNLDSWNPFAINPKDLNKLNTKGGQEMQREACKDKTITEILERR